MLRNFSVAISVSPHVCFILVYLDTFKSQTAENIRNNIYVDNVITGTETVISAIESYKEAKEIFTKASMNLRDWTSNNKQVLTEIPRTDKYQEKTMKVLGLTWTIEDDKLSLKASHLEAVSFYQNEQFLNKLHLCMTRLDFLLLSP